MRTIGILVFGLLLALLPVMTVAVAAEASPPPISQPLVTEAALAVSLAAALGVSTTTDEVVAESALGDIGIAPLNGWIAAYLAEVTSRQGAGKGSPS
jgi:hypothetical protein